MTVYSEYFSFFDQFLDVKVDLTEYLRRFSLPDNEINFSNLQPVLATVKNIFEQVRLAKDYQKNNSVAFDIYQITDGERIETVADNLYSSIEYWWIVAMFNGTTNLFHQWPKTTSQLVILGEKLTETEGLYPYPTYFKILSEENETNRNLLVLKERHVADFIWQIRKQVVERQKKGINI